MGQKVTKLDDTIDEESVDEESINSETTMNRLEQLVEQGCWESVLAHLQTTQGREDARKRNSTSGKLLYLSFAFYFLAPFHVIEALVKAYPEGILEPDTSRKKIRYPIEIAVDDTDDEFRNMVFKLFIGTNPKCLDNCPVGLLHEAFSECDTEVLELMIQTNPNFLYQKDSNNPIKGLPIHIACEEVMCKKIDMLLTFDPSQARMVEEDSKMLPLHLACRPYKRGSSFDMETFRRLIEAYPQAAKEKDAIGRLPLHYACMLALYRRNIREFVSEDFVSEVLKIYPEAAQIRDNKKRLPLHYLVIMHTNGDFFHYNRTIEKALIVLIETYPEALLQSGGEKDQLVLGRLANYRYPSRQIWHTAGSLCSNAFICVTCNSWQPLHHLSFRLTDLVENFLECPLDWTKNEGQIQDGELAGIILHYTFQALIEANHGLDDKSNLPLCGDLVRPCLPDDNKYSSVKTTLLHKLAYCSKFCAHRLFVRAVDLYASRQSAHFFQADNNGNLPLHLVCCAPPPSILVGWYERTCTEKIEANLVETFLTPCMEAASKTNHLGKTPLDILMETKPLNIESWGVVELLVNANPTEANKLFTTERMYLFMLAAIGEQANLSFTFSMLLSFVLVQNLNDLGSTTIDNSPHCPKRLQRFIHKMIVKKLFLFG